MPELFDIISDVHGCWLELSELQDKLGHRWEKSKGIHIPCDGRRIVFVGDVMDRGPYSDTTYFYAKSMVESGHALWVMGNHDNKAYRWAKGNRVQVSHGLDRTVRQFERAGYDNGKVAEFLKTLPWYLSLDGGKLVVVHAAWRDGLESGNPGVLRSWCLYAPCTGKTLPNGMPDRIDWVSQRQVTEASPWIVYGHQPYDEVRILNKTVGIDTGCVFGGKLTALRWPEMEIVQVSAKERYDEHPVLRGEEGQDG